MKIWMSTLFILGLTLGAPSFVAAQEDQKLSPTEQQQQKEKTDKEKKAYTLLEQIVDEAQLLRLPENRVRIQIGAADLLWEHNQGRARTLFALAAEGVAEMTRNASANSGQDRPRGPNRISTVGQLRQDLVLAVARHDATLAYQLLATTRPPIPPSTGSRIDSGDNLEERLLEQVAQLDPRLALQNAEQMIDKGQYSRSLAQVLAQLQVKDKDAAATLEDKLVKRLQSANMLSTLDASSLALGLLRAGPRPDESSTTPTPVSPGNSLPTLALSTYMSLLGNVIDAALKAIPPPAGSQRGANNFRGRRSGPGGGGGGQIGPTTEPTAADLEQANARRLLAGLHMMLPQIDQHVPGRSQAIRQKMAELGLGQSLRAAMIQVDGAMQQGTAESLMATAPSAPQMMQSRIYQQAALRALDEGNADRARQIANDHLEPRARESVLQAVEFRQASAKIAGSKVADVRQTLAGLRSDDERIDLLVQLSGSARPNNPKLAVELLNEARQFTTRRATNYRQLEQQLIVAEAFRQLDPARSFEIMEPGIVQLNELLTAAATLSGFEVNVFQDGELPLEGRNGLSNMLTRYGQVLGLLATSDFDQSQTLANRFQLSESRIVARLSIVRSLLGKESAFRSRGSGPRRFSQNTFIPRGQ
ncbi:hypothetical protein BH18ACI4_BH18ACI4_22730 [soil metagenome]